MANDYQRDDAADQWARYEYMRDQGHNDFVVKADKCEMFFAGHQWNQQDLMALAEVRRPALTINKIMSTLTTVFGEQIQNRMEVSFRPKSGAIETTADKLNKLWMSMGDANQLQWVRSDVFADGLIRSRGFYDARMEFDDNMQGEVRITKLNSKNVLIDPDAEEYDPDKWNDIIISKWLTPMDIELLYSKDAAEDLRGRIDSGYAWGFDSVELLRDRFKGPGNQNIDYTNSQTSDQQRYIRVLERQYRTLERVEMFIDPVTGDTREVPAEWDRDRIAMVADKYGMQVTKLLTKKIKWRVTADDLVLHDKQSPYKHFTPVPYFPTFRHGMTIGLVENLLGPQELLNKTTSQELHVVNTTANSGWMIKKGSLQNMSSEELEERGSQTGIVLELDEIANAEKIQPNQVPTGLDRLSYKAEEAIKSISNVSDSMQGFDREDVAAKAIAYKSQRGSVNLSSVMDNLERTDWILARNVLDLFQSFYTEPRVFNATHDRFLGGIEEVGINQPQEDGSILDDLTLGEYDVVVTSAPFRATLEDSQFEQAVSMRELGVAIDDTVLIENSRLARKTELVKKIQEAATGPEAQANKALEGRAKEAEVAGAEAKVGQIQAETRKKNADSDKAVAETAQDPVALERFKVEEEIKLAREKQDAELQLMREKAQFEQELKRDEHAQNMALKKQEAADKAIERRTQAAMQTAQTAKPTLTN